MAPYDVPLLLSPQLTTGWLGGMPRAQRMAVIGGRGGGGGVSADHKLQFVSRLRDERNHETAVKVPRPHMVYLEQNNTSFITTRFI